MLIVSDLSPYYGTFSPPTVPSSTLIVFAQVPRAPFASAIPDDVVMDIMATEFDTTFDGGFKGFLFVRKIILLLMILGLMKMRFNSLPLIC